MKRTILICSTLLCMLWGMASLATAAIVNQWASEVIDFSTEWGEGWYAREALGDPDATEFGDHRNQAWAPDPENGSLEFISLRFDTGVYATGANIYESCGNGFVYQVDVIRASDNGYFTVWSGDDPTLPLPYDTPDPRVFFNVEWKMTSFLVNGLKIYVDTDTDLNDWEEIDAVQLLGSDTPVPLPASVYLLGAGLLGTLGLRRKK